MDPSSARTTVNRRALRPASLFAQAATSALVGTCTGVLLVLAASCVSPQLAAAQPARGRPAPEAPTVFVTHVDGRPELAGSLVELGRDAVTLDVDGQRHRIPLSDVRRIERDGDSSLNGAAIGALVLGAWCAIVCGQGLGDASELPLAVVANGALGVLIGAGIDRARHGRTTLYPTPPRGRGAPRAAFGVTLRF